MGNILSLNRTSPSGHFDNISYAYNDGANGGYNNRLSGVEDIGGASMIDTDIDGSSNYTYDAIGNLKTDGGEGILNIEWTVSGKVKEVEKTNELIKFFYDAMGNRVLKQLFPDKNEMGIYTATWYSRDASGNIMATYSSEEFDKTTENQTFSKKISSTLTDLEFSKLNKKLLSFFNYLDRNNQEK
jgi:hypothetical protein